MDHPFLHGINAKYLRNGIQLNKNYRCTRTETTVICFVSAQSPQSFNVSLHDFVTCFAFERGRVRKGRWLWRKLLSVSVERDEREAGSATSATTREEASARAGSAASARTQVVV